MKARLKLIASGSLMVWLVLGVAPIPSAVSKQSPISATALKAAKTTKPTIRNQSTGAQKATATSTPASTVPKSPVSSFLDAATVAAARGIASTGGGPAAGDPIKIGLLIDEAGTDAVITETSQELHRGVDLAIGFLNQLGGITGRPILAEVADEGATADSASKAFDLLAQKGVVGVIGPVRSNLLASVAVSAEKSRIAAISATATASPGSINGLTIPWQTTVAISPAAIAAQAIAKVVLLRPTTSALVLAPADDALAQRLAQGYRQALGAQSVAVAPFDKQFVKGQIELDSVATAVTVASPDLIVLAGSSSDSARVALALERVHYGGFVLVDPIGIDANFARTCRPCEQVLTPLAYDPENATTLARTALLRNYFDKFATMPSQASAQGFAALQVLAISVDAAITKTAGTGEATRRAVMPALLAGRFDTPIGLLSYDDKGPKTDDSVLGRIVQVSGVFSLRSLKS